MPGTHASLFPRFKSKMSPAETLPEPPDHLSEASRALWGMVVSDYALHEHHLKVLQVALEAYDRLQQARATLESEGPIYQDRFGAPRKHPAVSIEETARIQFLRAVRELDLEGEALPDPRPGRKT